MSQRKLAFAVPGDLKTLTGGYIYDRRLMEQLVRLEWAVDHIELPAGFPNPSAQDMAETFRLLAEVPPDCPVIIDGLAFGAMDTEGVARIAAPIVALVHHPLAEESGLDPAHRDHLFETERRNLAHAARVIVPSRHTAEILTASYGVAEANITIATPGIDQPALPSKPTTPPLILSVGIQLPRKGHDVLLHALSEITDLDWQAVIVGSPLDGEHASMLSTLRISLGLQNHVQLAGKVSQETLNGLYQTASIFALATRYEGYGIVFDEALVHGLPIVSCDTGAVANTVPAAAGLLVPPDQPLAFAAALRRLLLQPDERQARGRASFAAGQLRPGWDMTADVVSATLQHIID